MEPAPSKPPEARMLSDSDIVKVSGVPDLKIIRYPELAQLATWSDLTNNSGTAAAVLYLTEDANTGHWIAAFNGPNDTAVVFDPLGMALDSEGTMLSPEKRAALGQNTKQFARLLVTAEKEGKKPSVNHTDFQEFAPNVNTCGRWVALRIRHRDKDSKAFRAFVADAMRQAGTKDADEWVASVTGGAMVGSGLVGGMKAGVANRIQRRLLDRQRGEATWQDRTDLLLSEHELDAVAERRRQLRRRTADHIAGVYRRVLQYIDGAMPENDTKFSALTILGLIRQNYMAYPTRDDLYRRFSLDRYPIRVARELADFWQMSRDAHTQRDAQLRAHNTSFIRDPSEPGAMHLPDGVDPKWEVADDADDSGYLVSTRARRAAPCRYSCASIPPPPPPGAGVSESKTGSGPGCVAGTKRRREPGAGVSESKSGSGFLASDKKNATGTARSLGLIPESQQLPSVPASSIDLGELHLSAYNYKYRPHDKRTIQAFVVSDQSAGGSGLVGAGKRARTVLGRLSANIKHPHDDVDRPYVEGRTEAEQRGFVALRRAMHDLGAFIDTLPAGDEKRLVSQWFTDVEEDSYTVPDAVDDFRTLRISEQTKRAMQPLIQRLIEADELLQTAFEEAEELFDGPNDEPEAEPENEGAGFFDTLANGVKGVAERVSGFVRGARLNYSPSADKVLQAHQPWTITNLRLYRVPVQKPISTALNVVSLGRFGAAKKEAGIDTLYHLMLLVNVQSPDGANTALLRVEKNAVINIDRVSEMTGGQEQAVPLPQPTSTFQTFMDKGRAAMGEKTFFLYDAFKNNCQDFVRGLLRANGVLTPEADAFLKQDVAKVQEKSGSFTHKVANFVTDLGARADRALQGGGRRIFGEMHLNQPGYNTYVTTSNPGGLLRPTSEDIPDILARIAGMVEADKQEVYRLKAEVTEEASAYPPATQTAVADIIRQSTRAIRNVRTNTDKNVDLAAVQLELADDIHFLRVASSLKDMINAFVEQLVNYVNSTRLLARTERQLPQDVISERSEVVYERDHPENDAEAPLPPLRSDAPATSENGLAGMGLCSDDVYVSDSDESCCPVSWGEQLADHMQGRS